MDKKSTPKRKSTGMPKEFIADMKFEVKFTANFNTSLSDCLKEKLTYLLNNDLEIEKFNESTRAYLADLLGCHDVKNKLNLVFFSGDTENTKPIPTPK
jgi:hypothetical protein